VGYIKNSDQLLDHGNKAIRKTALDIIEYALAKADPYQATLALITVENDVLSIGDLRFDLKTHRRIFLLGAGKASYPIAKALEDILGPRIADGVIVCKYGQEGNLSRSRLYLADHPIPDESGLRASQKALEVAGQTQSDDIVFGCVTGGSSALLPFPAKGVTLEDKKLLTRLLLTCGANIVEINAVRKHVSQIKGGRLAKAIHPGAYLINLTVSDVIGDPLDYITDPTVPDTSTLDDARSTLTKYDLWTKLPLSLNHFLKNAGPEFESPKEADLAGHHRHDFILVKGTAACEAAAEKARTLGFNTLILSTMLEGESKELGRTFGAIAAEIVRNNRPLNLPCVAIGGGETTVKIDGDAGEGGPNQEFAVSAALSVDDIGNVVVAGLDTDGTDGPTSWAGALVDSGTALRARKAGLDLFDHLRRHNVSPCLQRLGDVIRTGATGTNVNDLKIMVIMPADKFETKPLKDVP
jgi:hydroxypyruvate reductase/glycerate 2-kinase